MCLVPVRRRLWMIKQQKMSITDLAHRSGFISLMVVSFGFIYYSVWLLITVCFSVGIRIITISVFTKCLAIY